jgi:hypothetical protein
MEEVEEVNMGFPFAGRVRARMFVESGVHGRTRLTKAGTCWSKQAS